ncbi:MAG: 16S rRNA (cytosine(1402)-N(4))-methyltransferase RsmH [Ignavibacteriaceae bacterium]
MKKIHEPVLLKQALNLLVRNKAGTYFDGTLGFGGHALELLKLLNENGLLVATDVDSEAFDYSKKLFRNENRVKLYKYNFTKIDLITKIESLQGYDGIFADLGVSSYQLDKPEAGFTFRQNARLDMRMDNSLPVTAADVINSFSEEDIADILYKYGEEKKSRLIASKIVKKRINSRIESADDLSSIITELIPLPYRTKTLARVFQALRIFINNELDNLITFLDKSVNLLKKGGRIVVITYHSLEDRIVKEKFKFETLDCVCPKDFPVCKCDKEPRLKIITKKPLTPDKTEIQGNPRSRSAKLRAAERL